MNHGFAAAVEGDDGTGHGAHVRGVALQGFLHGLQFPGDLFAARFQRFGLVFVLGVVGVFQFGVDLVEAGCSEAMRRASRAFGSRRWRGAFWNACRSA